jgi:hypothetical protein
MIIRVVICTAIFLSIFVVIHYIHFNYFKINVVFYSAIFDSVLASILTGIILFGFPFFKRIGNFEKLYLFIIYVLVGYILANGIAVIDRSLSFYILEKLHQRGGGIRKDAFKQVFTQEYIKEHRLVDVRLTEQLESGTIKIKDDCVSLTDKGKWLAHFSRYFRQHWLPKKRLLMGEYTGDLTDPFRHSSDSYDYLCK